MGIWNKPLIDSAKRSLSDKLEELIRWFLDPIIKRGLMGGLLHFLGFLNLPSLGVDRLARFEKVGSHGELLDPENELFVFDGPEACKLSTRGEKGRQHEQKRILCE